MGIFNQKGMAMKASKMFVDINFKWYDMHGRHDKDRTFTMLLIDPIYVDEIMVADRVYVQCPVNDKVDPHYLGQTMTISEAHYALGLYAKAYAGAILYAIEPSIEIMDDARTYSKYHVTNADYPVLYGLEPGDYTFYTLFKIQRKGGYSVYRTVECMRGEYWLDALNRVKSPDDMVFKMLMHTKDTSLESGNEIDSFIDKMES